MSHIRIRLSYRSYVGIPLSLGSGKPQFSNLAAKAFEIKTLIQSNIVSKEIIQDYADLLNIYFFLQLYHSSDILYINYFAQSHICHLLQTSSFDTKLYTEKNCARVNALYLFCHRSFSSICYITFSATSILRFLAHLW